MERSSFRYDLHPKTEQEKKASMLAKIARIIDNTFTHTQLWLEEIDIQHKKKNESMPEDFKQAENGVATGLAGGLEDIRILAKNEQWPEGWEQNARDFITSLLGSENEYFLDRIGHYENPEDQKLFHIQDALSCIEDEKTKKIIYLALIRQNPVLFSEDPGAVVRPAVAQLLSRLVSERPLDSSDKFLMKPEEVVEKLLVEKSERSNAG